MSPRRGMPHWYKEHTLLTVVSGRLVEHFRYPDAYMTAAVAIGTTREDVDVFCKRLDACLKDAYKKLKKKKLANDASEAAS
eukprot:gene22551-27219_t